MDLYRRQIHARRGRLLLLLRAHRRHVQGQRHVGVAVRGRGGARLARRRARGRGHRQGGRRRAGEAQGLRRAQERLCRRRTTIRHAAGAREGARWRVEISALDRRPGRPSADRHRQDTAFQAAGLTAGPFRAQTRTRAGRSAPAPSTTSTGRYAMDRRHFIRSVAMAGAGAALVATRGTALAEAEGAATTRRFATQRWALDNIIRANGIDWDQPRSIYLSAPCGVEANADFAAIRARVQKMADIGPAFEATAKRREVKAREAEAEGNLVTARDNWYMAAVQAPPSDPTTIPASSISRCTTRSASATA